MSIEEYNRLNGMINSEQLMGIENGPRGYASPVVSSVLVFGPVPPSVNGDCRAVILPITEKCKSPRSLKAFELHERLRAVAMTPADRGDPSRVIQGVRQISMSPEAASQAVASSLLAYMLKTPY